MRLVGFYIMQSATRLAWRRVDLVLAVASVVAACAMLVAGASILSLATIHLSLSSGSPMGSAVYLAGWWVVVAGLLSLVLQPLLVVLYVTTAMFWLITEGDSRYQAHSASTRVALALILLLVNQALELAIASLLPR